MSSALPGLPSPAPSLPRLSSLPLELSQLIGQLVSGVFNFHCPGVCPHSSCLLSVVRGFRQGVVYGAKIRFPHALVMTAIFRTGSLEDKAHDVLSATLTHARSLGCYVALYKLTSCLLRHLTRSASQPLIPLIAGFVSGAAMFGSSTPITTQINMYVMSRVIFGLLRLAVKKGVMVEWESGRGYAVYAGLIWAAVMLLFETQPSVLQKSLARSMEYLYHDSDKMPQQQQSLLDWIIAEV